MEEKCNLYMNPNVSKIAKIFLFIQILMNIFVICVSFLVIVQSEDVVDGLKDVPSMLYLVDIDAFLGKYFLRYLNSNFPVVAKNHSFLHFKNSIRSMKGSHTWSRISLTLWSLWTVVDYYLGKRVMCPN